MSHMIDSFISIYDSIIRKFLTFCFFKKDFWVNSKTMSYHFDSNNRYQVIYPYTSDRIYVEPELSSAAYKCYQEIKNKGLKTYIFIVHDIDAGKLYYFNIPKYKDVDQGIPTQSINNRSANIPMPDFDQLIANNNDSLLEHTETVPIKELALAQGSRASSLVKPNPDNCSNIIITQENNVVDDRTAPESNVPSFDKLKQNEIITRLNHVEYELYIIKKKIAKEKHILKKKEEEESCVIM